MESEVKRVSNSVYAVIGPEGATNFAILKANDGGAVLIDARPVGRFAASHVPGAISIPLRPVFASWLGWLAPADRPLIIAADADQDAAEIAWQAAKIGYDNIIGQLDGGMTAWTAAGHDTASIPNNWTCT